MNEQFDPENSLAFKRVLGHFASGLTVVAAQSDSGPKGFTCQSFSSVSLEPPLVAYFSHKGSGTTQAAEQSGHFSVNILAYDQQNLARVFSVSRADKFHNLSYSASPNGSPLLEGVIGWVECDVEKILDAGDHQGVLGRVTKLCHASNKSPLVYYRGGYGTFEA